MLLYYDTFRRINMLTPIELQGKVFKTGFGYDKKDVEAFLKEVVDDYESLYKENRELNEKINVLSDGVQYYKSIEKTLQKALVLAEKTAQDTEASAHERAQGLILEAEKKAELIQREALAKADNITKSALHDAKTLQLDARKTLDNLKLQISSLVQQFEYYKIQYKQLMTAQAELLDNDSFMIDFSALKEQLVGNQEVTSSTNSNESYEEKSINQQNQYTIREITSNESQVYSEETEKSMKNNSNDVDSIEPSSKEATIEEQESYLEDDFIPTIDLSGIMEEARKEAELEEQMEAESTNHNNTASESEDNENTDYDYHEQEEITEQDLLQQLFSVNPKKKANKKNSSAASDDFEFLDI